MSNEDTYSTYSNDESKFDMKEFEKIIVLLKKNEPERIWYP